MRLQHGGVRRRDRIHEKDKASRIHAVTSASAQPA
jgi:hypothetical protein